MSSCNFVIEGPTITTGAGHPRRDPCARQVAMNIHVREFAYDCPATMTIPRNVAWDAPLATSSDGCRVCKGCRFFGCAPSILSPHIVPSVSPSSTHSLSLTSLSCSGLAFRSLRTSLILPSLSNGAWGRVHNRPPSLTLMEIALDRPSHWEFDSNIIPLATSDPADASMTARSSPWKILPSLSFAQRHRRSSLAQHRVRADQALAHDHMHHHTHYHDV